MPDAVENPQVLNLDIANENRKPILFRSKYGDIRLRRILTLRDLKTLLFLLEEGILDSKDFTVNVIKNVALIQEIDFSVWSDKEIVRLAAKWVKIALAKGNENQKIVDFDDFRLAVSKHVKAFFAEISGSIENLNKTVLSPALKIMGLIANTQFASQLVSEAIQTALATSRFILSAIPKLPDFSDFFKSMLVGIEEMKEAKDAQEILSESGYELGILLLDASELRGLKGKKFKPVVTRKLVTATMSKDFSKEIERVFSISPLQRRLPVIKQAMLAHQTRQFFLSTPVFIAQAEGVFTELLVVRNFAERVNGEVIGRRDGNRLISLQKKVNLVKGRFDPGLEKTAVDIVLDRMVSKRNAILHGGNNQYGTSRMSTETLLLLYALAVFLENDLDGLSNTRKNKRKNPRSSVKSA